MLEIFFVRHGSTTLPNRYIGSTDVELSGNGEREILQLKPHLQQHQFTTAFCSPLKRCVRSCELLELKNDVTVDERIREIDFGMWEKKTFDEICLLSPDQIDAWSRFDTTFSFPEGESLTSFQKRIISFAHTIESLTGERILVISHGGVIRHLLCAFLRLSFEKYLLFDIKCGKITTLKLYDQGAVLTGLNKG